MEISANINDWRKQLLDIDCTCQIKCVAFILSLHWVAGKACYPSQRTLAEEACVDVKTVRKALNFLEENGLIIRKKKKLSAFIYDMCEYEFVGVDTGGNTEGNTEGNTGGNTGGNHTPEEREEENIFKNNNNISLKSKNKYSAEFENWWQEYPKKVSKLDALKSFEKILKTNAATFDELLQGLKRYSWHCRLQNIEERYIKHPSTWLNQGCWKDVYNDRPSDEELASWKYKPEDLEKEDDWEFWRRMNEGEENV